MNATTKVKIRDITDNLTCRLCKGYMIDATTTIECLHSFCKSCIVKHLENSEYCPECGVQLHSTKPLCGIRSDQMLQEIIYKLVPGLFAKEMARRRQFYSQNFKSTPSSPLDAGQIFTQPYITSDDKVNLSLEYCTGDVEFKEKSKRYFHCPAGVSVAILKKLVRAKHEFEGMIIDIMYGERILPDDFLLMDIAYKYSWSDNGSKPLRLQYRVRDSRTTLNTTPLRRTPAARKLRSATDSEIIKSPRNGLIENDFKNGISQILPRKRRNRSQILNEKNDSAEIDCKKAKITQEENTNPSISSNFDKNSDKLEEPIQGLEKEVQLCISENGVISARNNSGEEKIIGSTTPAVTTASSVPTPINGAVNKCLNSPLPSLPVEPFAKPPPSINCNGESQPKYVKLNIPCYEANEGARSPLHPSQYPMKLKENGLPSPKHDLTSNGNKHALKPIKSKNVNGISKAIKMTNSNEKLLNNKKKMPKSTSPNPNKSNLPNPLPFPLSALASSGMTVNLIPSTELKQSGSLKPKNMPSPSTSSSTQLSPKRSPHKTAIVNGDLKFTPTRNTLPIKGISTNITSATPNGSPKKPPKFFKSRHNSNAIPAKPEVIKSPPKSENSGNGNTSQKHGSNTISPVGKMDISTVTSTQCFSNLVNSFTSSKLSTTTTPSRSTGTTPSTKPLTFQNPFEQQVLNLWNSFNMPNPLVPFVTNDFISMPVRPPIKNPYGGISIPTFPFMYPGIAPPGLATNVAANINGTATNSSLNGFFSRESPTRSSDINASAPSNGVVEDTSLDLSVKKQIQNGQYKNMPVNSDSELKSEVAKPESSQALGNAEEKVSVTSEKKSRGKNSRSSTPESSLNGKTFNSPTDAINDPVTQKTVSPPTTNTFDKSSDLDTSANIDVVGTSDTKPDAETSPKPTEEKENDSDSKECESQKALVDEQKTYNNNNGLSENHVDTDSNVPSEKTESSLNVNKNEHITTNGHISSGNSSDICFKSCTKTSNNNNINNNNSTNEYELSDKLSSTGA